MSPTETWTTPLGEPIGAPLPPGWQPPSRPKLDAVEGRWARLEPLSLQAHGADLADAFLRGGGPEPWTYRIQAPFATRAAVEDWLREICANPQMAYVAYIDRATGKAGGNGAFMSIDAAGGSIEIGAIMLGPDLRNSRAGTEALYLQMKWVFDAGYRRCEWTCDPLNTASMQAAARLGFSYEACFRQAYVSKGRNRDKAVFAVTDGDWPALAQALETWLDPANFDAEGRQRQSLRALTAPLLHATAPEFTGSRKNQHGQPIGAPVPDWTSRPAPSRSAIEGRYCRLEPLTQAHAADMLEALQEDAEGRVFTYMPNGPFDDLAGYRSWLDGAIALDDPLQFAIAVEGRAVGTASFLRIDPDQGSIEVGYITFSPRLQRTAAATEAMFLMMQWAFEAGYRRYEWKCNACNAPSRRAAMRLGLSYEGIFRQATHVKGRNRDTAWYAAIDSEWPSLKSAFETWLAAENFDAEGRQRQSLSDLTSPILVKTG
ncbi:MAG: GNAT family protein [Pseudomonadota bacterium]